MLCFFALIPMFALKHLEFAMKIKTKNKAGRLLARLH